MANRRKEEPKNNEAEKGRIKFRYTDSERTLDFTMENVAGDSVTEGLRSIANALAGRVITDGRRQGMAKPKPLLAPSAIDEEHIGTLEEEVPEDEEVQSADENEESSDGSPKPKRSTKIKAPKLLSDLNLTDANLPLADFVKQKNPADMMDKYSVIAVWLKEQFQITEVSIDHIFTAFKHLGIESQLPTNVVKPLKNLTHSRKWFEKGNATGTYSLNWLGESEVGKMGAGATKS